MGIAALGLGACAIGRGVGIASDQTAAHGGRESRAGQPSPAQVYRAACLQCHDRDGRGEALRDACPTIPDFTDIGWHASHADEELGRAILLGKGRVMRPMKSKLGALDVTQMVSFVRAFRGGGVVVAGEEEASGADKPPGSEAAERDQGPPRANPQPLATRPDRPGVASTLAAPLPAPAPTRPRVEASRGGSALYRQYCVSCHGGDGRGAAARAAMPALPDFTSRQWQARRTSAHLTVSILDGKGDEMPAWRGRLNAEQARDLVAFVRAFGPPEAAASATGKNGDFSSRFHQLQVEWENLEGQIKALHRP